MVLYHGSDKLFSIPDLAKCKGGKDFGKGLYLTTDYSQAVKWATRRHDHKGYVYTYEVRDRLLTDTKQYQIKSLIYYDKEWLDFVVNCRYKYQDYNYDLIYDKMADSTGQEMSDVLEQYFIGTLTVFEALALIKDKHPNHCQYCFKSDRIIKSELVERCKPKEVFR